MCVSGGNAKRKEKKDTERNHSTQATNGISWPMAHHKTASLSMLSLTLIYSEALLASLAVLRVSSKISLFCKTYIKLSICREAFKCL